jgi:hypothetical protein
MLFKNVVVYLLDKYLGDYIENLDKKKMKIDLLSGKIYHLVIFFKIICHV